MTEDDETSSITDDVRDADYYHGLLPREDIEPLLKDHGDYILRKTERNSEFTRFFHGTNLFILDEIILALSTRQYTHQSICQIGAIRHFMVQWDDGFYFEGHQEPTVSELISWHLVNHTPLTAESKAILRRPIVRPNWLLNHDSIKLGRKLGEGAFGKVSVFFFPLIC